MFERLRNDREINDREITAGYQLARFVTSPAQHSSLHKFGSGKHASLSCLELSSLEIVPRLALGFGRASEQ